VGAQSCKRITAVDFMPHLIEENRRLNQRCANVEWMAADATKLDLPPESLDVVFSNWLLMYLSDAEVESLFRRALKWLRPGGVLFFRESCFRQSGDKARRYNPTHYRDPQSYLSMLEAAASPLSTTSTPPAAWACYRMDFCRSVDTYVRVKGNQNQMAFRMVKVVQDTPGTAESRSVADGGPHSAESLTALQKVLGPGHIFTGGASLAAELIAALGVGPGMEALEVGCGAGGAAVMMAKAGATVHGMDASVDAVMAALQHSSHEGVPVAFEVCSFSSRMPILSTYDVAVVREGAMRLIREDTDAVATTLSHCLRSEGTVLVCDLVRPGEDPTHFADSLRDAGFGGIKVKDCTARYRECAEADLAAAVAQGVEGALPHLRATVEALQEGCEFIVYCAERVADTESSGDDGSMATGLL